MFEFAWLWALLALPLPLLIRLLPSRGQVQTAALRVPQVDSDLPGVTFRTGTHPARLGLAALAWICLVLAAARPQWLGEPINIPAKGRDLMVAVDLSGSMKVEDMVVNGQQVDRLKMIKHVLGDFIQRRVGDRLGLILFADTAYLQAPLTYDRDTVAQLLDETVIGLVGDQTAIGDAIGLAVKRFETREESNRILILLTDGQNTAGNISPEQANELAVANKVTIYPIGVGADQMLVQSFFGNRRVNPSADLDEDMLTELAKSTGGQYFRARDTQSLEAIYSRLDELEPIARESRQMRPQSALFYYPLALALLLSVALCLPSLWQWLRLRRRSAV
ncbi:VWA domain-containing protein [Lacimicrobium sp. SS2-24]|uniref:vWA domain-containing protein n=1 Tax=Lacimicrobium sp. SS2-24 TaxID=2005569 RepID=UPI000B4ADAF6|nr:VWA domain-containing protein [Lacimicrobium sp. SS2-24]